MDAWKLMRARHSVRNYVNQPIEEEKLAFRTKAAPSPEGERLLQEAVALLRQAKALHDRLEDAYRPHMDYAGLSKYTQGQIRKLFP